MAAMTFAVDIDGTITENGGGRIHLDALSSLRDLAQAGHNVIFVTGRSSVEGYLLAVFGGTTKFCVGENGGCITSGDYDHRLLGDKAECTAALEILRQKMDGVKEKPVFPRMTEVVLERTFDLESAAGLLRQEGSGASIADSQYAFHINSQGVNKGTGLQEALRMLNAEPKDTVAIGDSATDVPMFEVAKTSVALGNATDEVRSRASMSVDSKAGDGLLEAMDILGPRTAGDEQ